MNRTAHATACGLAGCAVLVTTGMALAAATAVETFTGQFQAVVRMPLTEDGGMFVIPEGPCFPGVLDFTPGSVTFEGQPVDFSGTEADFLASTYNYSYTFPALPGPVVVPVTGGFTGAGPVYNGPADGSLDIPGLELGPGFSENSLDVVPGQNGQHETVIPGWSSPVIPELNGRTVIYRLDFLVTGVEPVAGQVDVQVNGTVLAISCPADFDHDGMVGITDFLQMLAAWGPCAGCPEDLDGCGSVGIIDLLNLLSAWGPCPVDESESAFQLDDPLC